ncbi:hypothetical protein V7968_41470 [Nocardia vulneris]|uniref:WD40 repeat domain-containing protein n=1 Tax=Nocardia vulneris TaxID=1141657 RepID=UPI0030D07603
MSMQYRPHHQAILKVIATGNNDEVVTVSADGTAVVWDLACEKPRQTFNAHAGEVNSVALSPDRQFVVTGGEDGVVRIWSVATGACDSLVGHVNVVWRVAVSPDGRVVASGSGDNSVRLWDVAAKACLQELPHPDCVAAVAFDPIGERLVVGCDDAKLYVYKLRGNNHK